VSEADVGRVRVNQPATFTVDAYPGRTFAGTVTSIREAPINVQNVITYDAVIGVSNPDLELFPGMTANVKVLVSQRTNVLKVPNAALRFRPSTPAGASRADSRVDAAAEKAVWILDANDNPQRVVVTIGETDGTFTEVTGGTLKPGDRVIVAALAKAADGAGARPGSPGGGRGPGF
jgi:HlyD family secretion protein